MALYSSWDFLTTNIWVLQTERLSLVRSHSFYHSRILATVNAKFATYLQKFISPTFSRRMFNTFALMGPGILMLFISSLQCDTQSIIGRFLSFLTCTLTQIHFKTLKAIICGSLFLSGFAYAGVHNPNILDLAPNHAGVLFGITNTVANIAGFLGKVQTICSLF